VIHQAWKAGSRFDAWSEHFKWENWLTAFKECGLDPAFYAQRERSENEILPWSHIDLGLTSAFLRREYQKALRGEDTGDCRTEGCNACGYQTTFPTCMERFQGKNSQSQHASFQ